MAASCSPSPHVNLFGVHTAYGPPHAAPTAGTRAAHVAGTVLGLLVGAAAFTRGFLRKR